MLVMNPRGDCCVEIYLGGVTEPQAEAFVEAVADLARDHGHGNDFEDDHGEMRSLVILRPRPFPKPGFRFKRLLRKAVWMTFPNAEYPDPEEDKQ